MTSGQKVAFSLLITLVFSVVFAFTARSTNLLKILNEKYYSQTIINEKNENLNKIAKNTDSYIKSFLSQMENEENAFTKQECIRSYLEKNPSESLIVERRNLTAQLFEDNPALEGIRLIDKNGKFLHYSSFSDDVLNINGNLKTYKNYTEIIENSNEIDFNQIKVNETEQKSKIFVDSKKNRIIISIPFYLSQDIYSASLVCYFNFYDIKNELIKVNAISEGENLNLISENLSGGFVSGIPNVSPEEFEKPILEKWKISKSYKKPEEILQTKNKNHWVLLSSNLCEYLIVAGVYKSEIFEISKNLVYVLFVCCGITIFLIVFLLFSLKQSPEIVLKKKLKAIQLKIIKEYLDKKNEIQWNDVINQLKKRKNDLQEDIYASLGVRSKKQKKSVDELLEKSWNEIFDIFEQKNVSNEKKSAELSEITMEKLKKMFEEVLKENNLNINVANTTKKIENITEGKKVEQMESVENLENLEVLESAESENTKNEGSVPSQKNNDSLEEIEPLEFLEPESLCADVTDDVSANFLGTINSNDSQFTDSPDSFIRNDDSFPTTENLFAEEINFGTEYISTQEDLKNPKISVFNLPSMIPENSETTKKIENSQKSSKSNKKKSGLLALASAFNEIALRERPDNQTIVKSQNGIFQISQNLKYDSVSIDKDFKSLVDSVLK